MVQEYYVTRVRAALAERAEARSRVRSRAQAIRLRDEVRRKLRRCFGPLPARTPLNARVTGTLDRLDYRIEKVIFESRPGLLVTGNLYVPRRARGLLPAVLGACGHADNGKAAAAYQSFAMNLARQGYLVFIYDPISQGERKQYTTADGMKRPWGCVMEHNTTGNPMRLVGDFFGRWRVWDGIRALDYLLSRPEADASRVGVTGNSGGGTLSTYLTAFDPRFTMAAPSCFVTSLLNNLENELPADAEQTPPGMLAEGLDTTDYFIAHMPRPTLLLGQKNDYFDCRGLRAVYDELRRLYALFGAEEDIQLFIGPTDHGYSVHNREAMYRFFKHYSRVPSPTGEDPGQAPEKDEVLWATPKGWVRPLGSRRVCDFTRERAQALAAARKTPGPAELRRRITRRLGLPERAEPPYYRVLRARALSINPLRNRSRFAVETEPGILTLLHRVDGQAYYHLPAEREATVYVPHLSACADIDAGRGPEKDPFFAVDVRGMGETAAASCNARPFLAGYDADYFYAAHGDMLNAPYAGRRVHDLLGVLDLLRANGYRSIHLVGRGLGAITAGFAACLHPAVGKVTLYNALISYHELTQAPVQRWPLSTLVPGVLDDFDLPDCYRLLRAKDLVLVSPWTGRMEVWDRGALRSHLRNLGLAWLTVRWEEDAKARSPRRVRRSTR